MTLTPEIIRPQSQQEMQQSQSFYERFKQNLPLYDIPHSHYLFNTLDQNNDIFKHDQSFIELVNDVRYQSPWVAKAHDHFKNMTHNQMQKLLGLGNFAI